MKGLQMVKRGRQLTRALQAEGTAPRPIISRTLAQRQNTAREGANLPLQAAQAETEWEPSQPWEARGSTLTPQV